LSLKLCILGSGSAGNAAVVQSPRACLLIDAGLSLRQMQTRLAARDLKLADIDALIVTHTHGDHFRSSSITACLDNRILIYNHEENEKIIAHRYSQFRRLREHRLNATFGDEPLIINDLRVTAVAVPHDADGVTLAVTVEYLGDTRQCLAFATDLGTVPAAIYKHFVNSDVIVLEFNHDPAMLQNSKRTQYLKDRVIGASGHLSNSQAAAALRTIIARSDRPPLAVVPAHLSRECNAPHLVSAVVYEVLEKHKAKQTRVVLAAQDKPTEWLDIGAMRGQLSLF
jgi:phosphoribosyl 1,2-cyclic phosphodiesterase